jgi:hypothetical protein
LEAKEGQEEEVDSETETDEGRRLPTFSEDDASDMEDAQDYCKGR